MKVLSRPGADVFGAAIPMFRFGDVPVISDWFWLLRRVR